MFEDLKNNYNSTQIKFFRHQKWRNETWNVINAIENQVNLLPKPVKKLQGLLIILKMLLFILLQNSILILINIYFGIRIKNIINCYLNILM